MPVPRFIANQAKEMFSALITTYIYDSFISQDLFFELE